MDTSYIKSIALKWYFFTAASLMVYGEFCHLFMKQLGFNPQQIGITTLFGLQHLFLPLINFVGDKFRARNVVVWVASVLTAINCFLPLLPLVVSLPTCFGAAKSNHSNEIMAMGAVQSASRNGSANFNDSKNMHDSTSIITHYQNVPWISNLFFLMVISKSLTAGFEGVMYSSANVATISYLGKDKASFGSYYMWAHVGGGISVVTAAFLALVFRITICGVEYYGYFTAFIVATVLVILSMLSIPWFEFEYKTDRTINWSEVKRVIFDRHYICMFVLIFYMGACASFQLFWEFWYLDGLDASPLVMCGAALIRRPLLAISIFASCHVIKRVGDLNTIVVSFSLFAVSFFALSFTRIYWYVLAIDTIQAIAYGFAYSAFNVHISKAGTKASMGVILGMVETFFGVGLDSGSTFMGILFYALGTRSTLLGYGLLTSILLAMLLLYLKFSTQVHEYEKLTPEDSDEDYNYEDR